MLVFEILGFEIVTLLVGSFKQSVTIAAHAISYNVLVFVFILPLGFSIGSGTRVGNLLGEGNTIAAKFSAIVGFFSVGGILVLTFILLLSLRYVLPRAYTSDEKVIAMTAKILPIAAGVAFFDGIQTMQSGVIRALGKQLFGSIVNFLGYYIFSLPIGAGLAFGARWGGIGLWYGLLAGVIGAAVGYTVVLIFFTDWQKEAENAKRRVGRETELIDSEVEMEQVQDDGTTYVPLDTEESDMEDKSITALEKEDDDMPLIETL